MTIWHDAPPADSAHLNFRILRTPPSAKLTFIVLSAQHSGVLLHYWRGRSTPCDMQTCQPCQEGKKPRWYGYLYGMSLRTYQIIIFEFTQRVAPIVQDRLNQFKTLRGHQLTASRTGKKPNSPLMLEFNDTIHDVARLPVLDNLEEVLERMWERRETKSFLDDLPGQQRIPFEVTHAEADHLKNGHHPR